MSVGLCFHVFCGVTGATCCKTSNLIVGSNAENSLQTPQRMPHDLIQTYRNQKHNSLEGRQKAISYYEQTGCHLLCLNMSGVAAAAHQHLVRLHVRPQTGRTVSCLG